MMLVIALSYVAFSYILYYVSCMLRYVPPHPYYLQYFRHEKILSKAFSSSNEWSCSFCPWVHFHSRLHLLTDLGLLSPLYISRTKPTWSFLRCSCIQHTRFCWEFFKFIWEIGFIAFVAVYISLSLFVLQ